jgi:MFS transporter, MCT family, solute carrier family 16 (monocarboxylic acid transporters), member 10
VIHAASPQPLQTFWLLTIMNGASTIGRLTMAAFSDRTGQLNMHIIAQIVSSLLVMILWALAGSTTAAIAFCVFFGMFSGAVIGLPPASMANILNCTYNTPSTKVIAHGKLGQWTGMMYSFAAIPSLVGPVVAGHLVTEYSTYITVQMWAGANLMISALCMIAARWYLPCYDHELVSVKVARMLGRHHDEMSEDKDKGKGSDTEDEMTVGGISQATTRVPSEFPSRDASNIAMSGRAQGSDRV